MWWAGSLISKTGQAGEFGRRLVFGKSLVWTPDVKKGISAAGLKMGLDELTAALLTWFSVSVNFSCIY